ncbi:MAG: PAS domain-containing sensor histidine kinase [Aquincola sp.]|nr:PAS domain-containing sensor histidine kinase [Aquincola sp.]MDH4287411.1 PAS domain-containing sensor histidine kinase [Aquincola sp.]MDH5329622.1 PAS domain-containing sensor histidine kinase [Aquincola sp.]
MSEPPASDGRLSAPKDPARGETHAAGAFSDVRATVALVLAIVVLVGVAALPLVWRESALAGWAALGSALLLGAGAVAIALRLSRQSRDNALALAEFARHLRVGDVPGALRAVRAESPYAVSAWGDLDGVSTHDAGESGASAGPTSRFDRGAREVELAFGERERRWQARMRLSADWHWETDETLKVTWVSQDLASLVKLGVQPSDLVGHQLDAVPLFQAPAEGWGPVLERVSQRKSLRDVTLEVLRRGRSPVWITLNGRAVFDDAGRFTGYEGVGRDVTEARLAHQRLADSEKRHSMMADLAADWYWQTDVSHRFTEVGPVAMQIAGDRAEQLIGRARWEVYSDGASATEWAAHRADLDAHRPFRGFEFAVRQGGRSLRWVSISGVPRLDERGEFLGYHGVGRDITLKKRAERLLLTRNEQLERLVAERTSELEQTNRDLEAFSRQLAHELRTPIGQVVGLSDMIKSRAWDRLSPDEREWLRLTGQAAREMSHTVTALLELARSTSTALLLEPVDLSALAGSVIADLPWLERKAPVQWVVQPGLVAHCSAALARVVLMNLLGNAAKFTREVNAPRVEFGSDSDGGDGMFFVQDNGAGFDDAQAATLFQPFVRLHRSEQFQGTGLGLSIVRRIVERHAGHVSARGEPGCGARFVFRFGPARAVDVPVAGDTAHDAAA